MGSTEISSSSMVGADPYGCTVSNEMPAGELAGSVGRVGGRIVGEGGAAEAWCSCSFGSVGGPRLE